MAIYHLHVKNISRRDGRSAVAAAAYRAGETLPNAAEERDSAFAGKRDVVFTDIRLPAGAPAWMSDRASLWNAAEAAETRKDARLAKEIEFALPLELPRALCVETAVRMAEAYVALGHVVDVALHDDGSLRNPHVHLLLTTRAVGADGFLTKLRAADGRAFVTDARKLWAAIANAALGKVGAGVEIDARSHAARGLDQTPTKHRGPDPAARRARRWGARTMDHETSEARRELLGERHTRERFALLAARPDWPPERRQPVPGLTPGEAQEWQTFWREVDKRLWGPELHPVRADDEELRIESRDPVRFSEALEKLTTAVARDGALREARLDELLPTWRELHTQMRERMRADGHRTDHPLDDWKRVEASLRDFDAKITQLRLQEAKRRAFDPVPDPDGRPIHPDDRAAAEDMLLLVSREPGVRVPTTPRPEHMPDDERAEARAAVERQNDIEVTDGDAEAYRLAPHEGRLDWLDNKNAPLMEHRQQENRLDWLGERERTNRLTDREPDR